MKIKSVVSLIVLFLTSVLAWGSNCDGSGNCYLYAGATGRGTGASWTDACTGFTGTCAPSGMTRGVTYWVGAGNYGTVAFNTPDSGTSVITIEAATASAHGPASDWSSSFAGQAVFGGDTAINTDYWTFNGQGWPSGCTGTIACGVTGYNLYFDNTSDSSTSGAALFLPGKASTSPQTGITLNYIEVQGFSNGTSDDGGIEIQCANNNFYLGNSYVHDVGVDLIEAQYTCSGQNYTGVGWTFEHDYLAHNHRGDSAAHAQAIATGAQNLTVRYSIMHDITSSGGITDPFPGVVSLANWAIYGNTFEWDNSETAGVGDGMVGLFGETFTGYLNIYNNTLANINNADCPSGVCNAYALFVCGASCGSGGTVTAQVYNNLWWNPSWGQAVAYDSSSSWTAANDYNEAICPTTGCAYSGQFTTSGSHDVFSTSGNPFVNFDGVSNFNVALTADTSAGISESSSLPTGCTAGLNCYNIDGLGTVRGSDGTWDRGAEQLASEGSIQLLSIAVTAVNSSIAVGVTDQFTATGTYSNGTTQNLTSSVTWSSSSTAVATISSAGLATGVAAGSATIKATSGTISGSTGLTVTAPVTLVSIAVAPASASVTVSGTQQYTATGTYSDGTTQNLTSSVTWSSSSTAVATISSTGIATGVAPGGATIKATSGTISGSVTLTVNQAVPTISAWPTASAITYGQTLASSTLTGGTASVPGTFAWTTPTTVPGAGTPSESVTFRPSDNIDYSVPPAGSVTLSVGKATPAVTVSPSASSITTAQTLRVTIAVTGPSTPTGSVILSSESYSSTSTSLTGGSATITIPAGALATGPDTLTASYLPDTASAANYTTATGTTAVDVTVATVLAATVTLNPSASNISFEQPVAVAVAVAGVSGQAIPTGTVALSSGSYTAAQQIASGNASFSIPAGALSNGTDTLLAAYSGDGTYGSANGTATITISPFIVSASNPSPIPAGSVATTTATTTADSSYSGTINLSCAMATAPIGAQDLPVCSVNPTTLTLSAGGNGPATVNLSTTGSSTAFLIKPNGNGWWATGSGAVVCGLLMFGIRAKRRRWLYIMTLLSLMVAAGTIGCVGPINKTQFTNPGTTAGTYVYTITATDSANSSLTVSSTITVTVQ